MDSTSPQTPAPQRKPDNTVKILVLLGCFGLAGLLILVGGIVALIALTSKPAVVSPPTPIALPASVAEPRDARTAHTSPDALVIDDRTRVEMRLLKPLKPVAVLSTTPIEQEKSSIPIRLEETFAEAGFYSMRYPAGWTWERPQENVVLFASAAERTDRLCVVLQYLPTTASGGKYATLDDAARDLSAAMQREFPAAKIQAPTECQAAHRTGRQFMAEIDERGLMQLFVMAMRADERAICVWFYRCPKDASDETHAQARAMFDSWALNDSQAASTVDRTSARWPDDALQDTDSREIRDPLFR